MMSNTWKCDVCKSEVVKVETKTEETEDDGNKTKLTEKCFVCKREVVEGIKTEYIKEEDIKQEMLEYGTRVDMLEHNMDVAIANRSLGLAGQFKKYVICFKNRTNIIRGKL